MKIIKPIAAFFVGFLLSTIANAASSITNVTVKEAAINRAYGNYVFIHLSSASSGAPSCAINTYWQYTLSLDGLASKELYSMLLAAAASGKLVSLTGTGLCSEFYSVESLQSINLLN
jgi:hypothetical protein